MGVSAVFSGYVGANEGFDGPVTFKGPKGWTVNKLTQTEIYVIRHDLKLKSPKSQLHIVATPADATANLAITSLNKNSFTVTVLSSNDLAAMATDFMFIAHYSD